MEPLRLYHRGASPNPWKVLIMMEELKLPYELIAVSDGKGKDFLAINPNGRVPALEDPNSNVTTWESGSIIDYVIETYDRNDEISYSSSPERFLSRNWMHFQMSGQGPYFGQKAWFSKYHQDKLPSAEARYANEIERILGVIESHLDATEQLYLVGTKATYADLMWVPWNELLGFLLGPEFDFKAKFPRTFGWHQRLLVRDGVQRMMAAKAKAVQGL